MLEWGRLGDLVKNGRRLSYDDSLLFIFSMDHIQLFAIELNTGSPNIKEYGQLFLHGIDSKGILLSKIGGDYAPRTIELKELQNLPFNHITLYDEGDFYRSFDIKVNKKSFTIIADSAKEDEDLTERWGDNIIGLTDESISKLNIEVLPELIKYILSELLH